MARSHIVLAFALLTTACSSVDLDVSDHDATFLSARARKELSHDEAGHRTFAELGFDSVEGTASTLDYRILAMELGLGIEADFGESCWAGISGGIALHDVELDTTPADFDDDSDLGGYVALEGGYRLTSWAELYARADSTLYFGNLTTRDRIELGARFPLGERATVFAGWREARYAFDDVEPGLVFDSIDLELSGLVVGLVVDL